MDENGFYRGENLEPGLYTIVAATFTEESPEALAAARVSQPVLVELKGGEEQILDFELK